LADTRDLPLRRSQVGDRHLNFHDLRDNLRCRGGRSPHPPQHPRPLPRPGPHQGLQQQAPRVRCAGLCAHPSGQPAEPRV